MRSIVTGRLVVEYANADDPSKSVTMNSSRLGMYRATDTGYAATFRDHTVVRADDGMTYLGTGTWRKSCDASTHEVNLARPRGRHLRGDRVRASSHANVTPSVGFRHWLPVP